MARSMAVVIFEISAGWNLTGPNANHERDPLTSTPRKMTATSRIRTKMYAGVLMTSHSLGFMTKRMSRSRAKALSIQIACLPLLQFQSNMEDGSEE